MNKKIIFLVTGFFLLAALIFGGVIFNKETLLKKFAGNDGNNFEYVVNTKQKNKKNKNELICEEGWEKYKNDVLGLGFCYPIKWGNVVIEPIQELTSLEGALAEYAEDENNIYNSSLFIKFEELQRNGYEKGNDVVIRVFNEKYQGEHYPNIAAYERGYLDNIGDLKKTKNICDYKINFTELWEEQGRMTEFWQDCERGIKTQIINHEQYFDKSLYSYVLEAKSYFNLQNNFFDNVLITRRYLQINQVEKKINDFNQIFEAKDYSGEVDNGQAISPDEYASQKEEFTKFIESVYRYVPPVLVREDFKKNEGEDAKVITMRKYYWLLENQKLEEAYQMHNRINISLDDFKSLYEKTRRAEAQDFKKINDNTYKFVVDYQLQNKPQTLYRITMRIVGADKLEIISTDEIISKIETFGDYRAYVKKQNGKVAMILEQYGVEIAIDEGEAQYNDTNTNIESVKSFGDIKFSESGKYLIYRVGGWEWSMTYLYDIASAKKVLEFSSGAMGFSQNEESFFNCSGAGLTDSAAGIIYSVPEFKKKFELFDARKNESMNVECYYNQEKNELTFLYGKECESEQCKKTEVVYSFEEDKMISSRILSN